MVVQHNMQAANTNRQLGITSNAQAKSTEKLSSGYKINRAADDAAGLSISEKMRSQIRGLDRASTNASDGISVVQTAEGALNEVHSILQRMNELATQAANDTNTSVDRTAIKQEIDQLASEITRVSSTTQFNTMNLLDGNFTNKNLQVGALSGQNISISISSMSATSLQVSGLGVSSFTSAGTTMSKVQAAIDTVSTERSKLGAIQNRLEHTIANLDTTSENTSSAESRIRDTDMAKEMVTYSK
ncbi:MAG: flagellin, partial [Lachnospiraceae bacterium]|nr:flagellin [Lachnospiraceae bacterium]